MTTDLERAHTLSDRLVAARADHRRAEHALAVLLAELVADQLFRPLGYTSVEEFSSDRLDLIPSRVLERLVAARSLGESPPEAGDPAGLAPALRTLFDVVVNTLRASLSAPAPKHVTGKVRLARLAIVRRRDRGAAPGRDPARAGRGRVDAPRRRRPRSRRAAATAHGARRGGRG